MNKKTKCFKIKTKGNGKRYWTVLSLTSYIYLPMHKSLMICNEALIATLNNFYCETFGNKYLIMIKTFIIIYSFKVKSQNIKLRA